MIERLTSADALPALERFAQFAAQRHRVIVNNIANLDTPGFRPADVSVPEFQRQLGAAIDVARRSGGGPLALEATDEVRVTDGRLELDPTPLGEGPLLADGNDRDPERIMQDLVENFMAFRATVDLIRSRYELINTAIRERV